MSAGVVILPKGKPLHLCDLPLVRAVPAWTLAQCPGCHQWWYIHRYGDWSLYISPMWKKVRFWNWRLRLTIRSHQGDESE